VDLDGQIHSSSQIDTYPYSKRFVRDACRSGGTKTVGDP
jgi:hypothetical protein